MASHGAAGTRRATWRVAAAEVGVADCGLTPSLYAGGAEKLTRTPMSAFAAPVRTTDHAPASCPSRARGDARPARDLLGPADQRAPRHLGHQPVPRARPELHRRQAVDQAAPRQVAAVPEAAEAAVE